MSPAPPSNLSRLKIVLCCELDEQGRGLLQALQRTRAQVRHVWPPPERIGENADLVACEYTPDLAQRLAWMPGEATAALVVLLPQSGHFDVSRLQAATPDAVLHRPYTPAAITAALMLAVDHFSYGQRQRTRIRRLDENIRSLREIERAKLIIMAQKRVGEDEAYTILRKAAMRRGVTVSALAESLLDKAVRPD
jgi:AmiR/NasT family two-component response regulator